MSKFIVIEGLDGAGKSTQIKLLVEHFKALNINTQFIHFPRSGQGVFGELIAQFLRGEFGAIEEVHPQLVALLFAEDRKDFAATIEQWLAQGDVVLADRYVFSNIAFQCAKLKTIAEKKELRDWILDFEFVYNKIPQADLSIYLDVPFAFTEKSLANNRKGEERAYLKGKTDIHENSLHFQRAVKQEYDALVKEAVGIQKIACFVEEDAEVMLAPAIIHRKIVEALGNVIASKG